MYRLRVISRRTNFGTARPDPNRPRYEDPGQNTFRSEKKFKEERTKELKSGDKKRLLPLKTLVPEEYRGARYYTDREMEFVDPKNSKMRLFGGPYSLFFPHKLVYGPYNMVLSLKDCHYKLYCSKPSYKTNRKLRQTL